MDYKRESSIRRLFARLCLSLVLASVLAAPFHTSSSQAALSPEEAIQAALPGFERLEVGPDDFRISYTGGDIEFDAEWTSIAYNPTDNEYLVVWMGDDFNNHEYEVYGQRIHAATGEEVGVNDFRISNMGPDGDMNYDAYSPSVAYNSSANEYLVVWEGDGGIDDEFEIYGQRLTAAGDEIGANDFRISNMGPDGNTNFNAIAPKVTYNSTDNEYLVVWYGDHSTNEEYEVYGQRLSASGAEIGANDFRISDMGPDGDTNYAAFSPDVIYNATDNEYLVVWHGDDNTAPLVNNEVEIFGQRLASNGAEVGVNDFRISDMGPNGNTNHLGLRPSAAYNSTNNQYLIVWYGDDTTSDEYEIYGQLLTAAGAETGTNDFRLSDMGPAGDVTYAGYNPEVVYNTMANEYLVVWDGNDLTFEYEIYGQRLTAAGVETGPDDFRISDMGPDGNFNYNGYRPDVAYNSTDNQYLGVWEGDDEGLTLVLGEYEIFGQLLLADGTETGENDFRISDMGGDTQFSVFDPKVAYNSAENEFLVVWAAALWESGEYEIMGQRVNAATGELLGENFRISDMGPDGDLNASAFSPSVTYNPTDNQYLVVWEGTDLPVNEQEIYGQRLGASGAEIGANDFRISDMGPNGSNLYAAGVPSAVYNHIANEYLVVWHGDDAVNEEFEIYGQRLSADGVELGTNDFRITHMGPDGNTSYSARQPSLIFNPDDIQYLVVWEGVDNLPAEYEVYGRILDGSGAPTGAGHIRLSTMGPDGDPMYIVSLPKTVYNPVALEYLVVWNGDDAADNKFEIYGQRLSTAGVEVGEDDFRISTTGGPTDVTFYADFPSVSVDTTTGEYIAAWRASTPSVPNEYEIFVQRLHRQGGLLDEAVQVSEMGSPGDVNYYAINSALAYNPVDDQTLVVWTGADDRPTMTNQDIEVFGQLYAVWVDVGLSGQIPAFTAPSANLTAEINASNNGLDLATGLKLSAILPAGVSYVSATGAGWTCAEAAGEVACEADSLDANTSTTINLTIQAPAVLGPFTVVVSITSTNSDVEPANNSLLLTSQVTPDGLPLYARYLPMTLRP